MINLFGRNYSVDKHGARILACAIVITLTLSFAFPSGSIVANNHSSSPLLIQQDVIAASYGTLNATDLWTNLWNSTSLSSVTNYVRELSENYPNRTWTLSNMSPSANLEGAWTWANDVLETNTDGELSFDQITSFQSLIAIKAGTDPAPRPAILISGVIDSKLTPGANDAGSSVSAVLETARILHNYTFSCDIYYILLNGGRVDDDTSLGGKALVEWLEDNNIDTLTALEYDRLIYEDVGHALSPWISIRAEDVNGLYQSEMWLSDIMMDLSSNYGIGRVHIATDLVRSEGTFAYEMWQVGRPAIHIIQGYIFEGVSGSALDTWDYEDYNYTKIQSAVAAVASAAAYVGLLGDGESPTFYSHGIVDVDRFDVQTLTMTINDFMNVSVSWDNSTTLNTAIYSHIDDDFVYERIEDDGYISMKYLVPEPGKYSVLVYNIGPLNTSYTVNTTSVCDIDGDTLSNTFELAIGTNVYVRDSDHDELNDDFELELGTSPISSDSDNDGASDGLEYSIGSNMLLNDTDGDNLSDGFEIDLGINPTEVDTDFDGLDDYSEVYEWFTNPAESDSDSDGLWDGFETLNGLNPLSPDSDGDSLGDLFEILNGLNPLSLDSDNDGWSDAYEVEFCLDPLDPDTDQDGIPDSIDWDPREHWISVIAPVGVLGLSLLILIFGLLKHRVYFKE